MECLTKADADIFDEMVRVVTGGFDYQIESPVFRYL
jgi:hypothetical protein